MEYLSDLTVGIIFCIKHSIGSTKDEKDCLNEFFQYYFNCPNFDYTEPHTLYRLLMAAFHEFIVQCDDPRFMLWNYHNNVEEKYWDNTCDYISNKINCLIIFFGMIQVMEKDFNGDFYYINGFHDTEIQKFNTFINNKEKNVFIKFINKDKNDVKE